MTPVAHVAPHLESGGLSTSQYCVKTFTFFFSLYFFPKLLLLGVPDNAVTLLTFLPGAER